MAPAPSLLPPPVPHGRPPPGVRWSAPPYCPPSELRWRSPRSNCPSRPRPGAGPARRRRGLPLRPVPVQRHHAACPYPPSSATRARAPSWPSAKASPMSRPGDRVVLNWAPSCGIATSARLGEVVAVRQRARRRRPYAYARTADGDGALPRPERRRLRRGDGRRGAGCVLPAARTGCRSPTPRCSAAPSSPDTARCTTRARVRDGRVRRGLRGRRGRPGHPPVRADRGRRRRSSRSMSPRRRRSWRGRPGPRSTSSPPRPPPSEIRALTGG